MTIPPIVPTQPQEHLAEAPLTSGVSRGNGPQIGPAASHVPHVTPSGIVPTGATPSIALSSNETTIHSTPPRQQLRTPEGMPANRVVMKGASQPRKPYKEIGMLKAGLNMDLNNAVSGVPVPYLNASARQPYEVAVGENGLLYQIATSGEATLMHTEGASNPRDAYLHGMSAQGNVYPGSSTEVKQHSSFFAGNPGAAFGTMSVNRGQLRLVTDRSGHYCPPLDYSRQFQQELQARGADLSHMQESWCRI
jgi:hypothetical protein